MKEIVSLSEIFGIKNVQYCFDLVVSVCHNWLYKLALSVFIVVSTFLFDPLHIKILFSLFFLVMIDFITGIYAAYKEGHKIQSHKIARTAIKLTLYFTTIAIARVSEDSLHLYFLDETIIGFFTGTELISNLENIERMGYPTPTHLVKKLKKFISKK